MRIGLIDVDGHNFPNLPLMKLSAWHKRQGDHVEWYDPWNGFLEEYDKVYMSKIFSFTADYEHPVYAKEIQMGGEWILYPSCGRKGGIRLREGHSPPSGDRTHLSGLLDLSGTHK